MTGISESFKRISLHEEVYTSTELIKMGLCEMEKIDGENDFYFPTALLLSNGFERLMKCIYCYHSLEHHGKFPTVNDLKRIGHDLEELKNKMINDCICKKECEKRDATKDDYHYLKDDAYLQRFIELLSHFSDNEGRYYNLNAVCGANNITMSPKDLFDEYEQYMVDQHDDLNEMYLKLETDELLKKLYDYYTKIIVERFTRALCRQFVMGILGDEAKKCLPYIGDFLYLKDSELGQTKYCKDVANNINL